MDSIPYGIPNTSGVACHLSSALQLLLHAIPALRVALLETAKYPSKEKEWIHELANLTLCLFDDTLKEVNPLPLYEALSQSTRLDPHELGDAATALRVFLHTLQQDSTLLQPLLKDNVLGGTIEQTLVGECCQGNRRIRRIKSREKTLSCPFPVIPDVTTSLVDALCISTIQPQTLLGLDWNQVSGYQEEQGDCNGDDSEWTTHKTIRLTSLPQHLIFHLQRAHYQDNHVALSTIAIDVPLKLDMTPFVTDRQEKPCCLGYQFVGAILHVSDNDDDIQEEEDGHYVALVQGSNCCWYLMDDDKVILLPDEQEMFHFVSGRPTSMAEKLEGSLYCATILAYSKACECTSSSTISFMRDLRESLQKQSQANATHDEDIDWNQPDQQVVGRRLRVRWKSGKYYAGTVSSYDDESGKHCITYNDGDVRHYNLNKKTIEWINDD
jgi:hypothetical protein